MPDRTSRDMPVLRVRELSEPVQLPELPSRHRREGLPLENENPVLFEHVRADSGLLESGGEHMMSEAGAVKCVDNFFSFFFSQI